MANNLERNCPECDKLLSYVSKNALVLANKNSGVCISCPNTLYRSGENHHHGKKFSDEHRQKLSKSHIGLQSGKNHPMYGKHHSEETKLKLRLKRLDEIIEKHGKVMPNYNPDGCKIIDEYGKKYGYNFQHAENGGEVNIDGYYPDGLDEKRKTIIEVDEKHHFKNRKLRMKDIKRQQYLENIGYEVIRIKFEEYA